MAVLLPVAVFGTVELLVTIASAGLERPYVARLMGMLLLSQLAIAAAVAGALNRCGLRLPDDHRPAGAFGLTFALNVVFVMANGTPPLLPQGGIARGSALGAALAVGLVATVLRYALWKGGEVVAALVCEPLVVSLTITGGYGFLRALNIEPLSRRGLAFWSSASVAAFFAIRQCHRRRLDRSHDSRSLLWKLLLVTVVIALMAVILGRAGFPTLPHRTGSHPDVLLVVLDTTRADFAPALDGASWSTPALGRLKREGRWYPHAFSTSCWTVPAHGSLFTGLMPSEHGATWESPRLSSKLRTLAERFSEAGYRTAGFSANPWIQPELGFDQGFGRFVIGDINRRPLWPWLAYVFPTLVPGSDSLFLFEDKAGLALASEALRFLGADPDRPAFVFLNLMEPHLPYWPPLPFLRKLGRRGWDVARLKAIDQDRFIGLKPEKQLSATEVEGLRALYAGEVAYADYLLSRLFERLGRGNRLDRTLVVVTGDHGENLGQHPPLDHQLGLYDTLLRVPLLIRFPEAVSPGSVENGMISLVDVPGAILSLVGIAGEGERPRGLSLPPREAVFFEYDRPLHILDIIRTRLRLDPSPWDRSLHGIRTAKAKWILASDGRHQAYDLETDPDELKNLVRFPGDVPAEMQPLAARLLSDFERRRIPPDETAKPGISEELKERLRSLGYVR